jgi:hypothetical protein
VEEIAYRMRFINRQQMQALLDRMADNSYKGYLLDVVREVDGDA